MLGGSAFYNATQLLQYVSSVDSASLELVGFFQYSPAEGDVRNSADALWILFASFLVFFMQAGRVPFLLVLPSYY